VEHFAETRKFPPDERSFIDMRAPHEVERERRRERLEKFIKLPFRKLDMLQQSKMDEFAERTFADEKFKLNDTVEWIGKMRSNYAMCIQYYREEVARSDSEDDDFVDANNDKCKTSAKNGAKAKVDVINLQ